MYRTIRIPTSAFSAASQKKGSSSGALKEETFANIRNMRRLPYLSRRRRPTRTRTVSRVYYRNTGQTWPGFGYKHNFAVRWTGSVNIKKAGYYRFYTYSDDGSKMWIDGRQIVNNDGLHGWRGRSGGRRLRAGKHSFKVTFFERSGGHGVEAKYRGPDTRHRTIRIPASAFLASTSAPKKPTTPAPSPSGGNLKEETFANIRNMRRLPYLSRRRRPTRTRTVLQVYYRNTGQTWPGFGYKHNFAVRWTGSVNIKKAGYYRFYTYSDDGSKMWIDGRQ